MSEFTEEYSRLLNAALESGSGHVSLPTGRVALETLSLDAKQGRQLLSACHRGFEKAQNRIVHLLQEMEGDATLPSQEENYRKMLLRKVIDAIAMQMLAGQTWWARRLALHDTAPYTPLDVIQEALDVANALNRESRQTFALVADLSTFVHVADLLRVDFRGAVPTLSMIELKSGQVNEILMKQLEMYNPREESLKLVEGDSRIPEKYKAQAKRMLRQRIRISQIQEILTTDQGKDIRLERPIRLTESELQEESYDLLLNDLCAQAKEDGLAAGSVDRCIHIGVGFSREPEVAKSLAIDALHYAIMGHLMGPPGGLNVVLEEVKSMVPKKELFKVIDLVYSNLVSVPCRPLVLWGIDRENLMSLITGELFALAAFDVSGFLWLGRQVGLEISLSTRREASETSQDLGSSNVPTWGGRTMIVSEGKLLSGFFSRFFNDLARPARLLNEMNKTLDNCQN